MKSKKFFRRLVEQFFDGGSTGKEVDQGAGSRKDADDLEAIAVSEQRVFRYEALAAATRKFSPKQKLGEGGFGPVFKGRLEDGREVAVKRLGAASRQGAKEFMNEAMMLSKVQHKNLVNLYGYCTHGDEKLLVYEYVCNESLDKILFSREKDQKGDKKRGELDWRRRFDVIAGVGRGLLYLHEDARTPIVHRDIKAGNILLDDDWAPKIADFGMARLFPVADHAQAVKTRVVGTNGYMAPEYVMHGVLSPKADVFSFGVLVLELVSGRRNSASGPGLPDPDARSLLEWAWRLHRKGRAMELLDPALRSAADAEQVATCVHLGLLCVQPDPKLRPDMDRVMLILSKRPRALEEPTRPGVPPAAAARHRGKNPRQASEHGDSVHDSSPSAESSSSSASAAATTRAAVAGRRSPLPQERHSEPS